MKDNSPSPNLNLELAVRLARIRPKQALGQNFLIDDASLGLVASAAKIKPSDTILEVGPGLGFLTAKLCQQAKQVVAVESDVDLAELLGEDAPYNLRIVPGDIRSFNLLTLPKNYKVVANIPYYLTSQLLRMLLESPNPPCAMSLMVQREVAERITAKPGKLSILALSVQYYAYAKIVGEVERYKFWPAPKVDSAVISLERRLQPAFDAQPDRLFRLIRAGFGERRKMLKNSLAGGLNASDQTIATLLKAAKIAPSRRAQELSLKEWDRIYQEAASQELI